MQVKIRILRTSIALLLWIASPALACTVSASPFQFGVVDPLIAAETTSTSSISVTCPSVTTYTIALSAGSGTFAERQMQGGSYSLIYNLDADAARTTIWGDGSGISTVVTGSASTAGTTHNIYGKLPHQPTAVPGVYSDSIVVTLSF